MDRKQVLLDDGQMARQREFTEKIHAMHQARGRTPLALVDTFGSVSYTHLTLPTN